MEEKKFKVFVYITACLFLVLSVTSFIFGHEYKKKIEENNSLLKNVNDTKLEYEKLLALKGINIFDLAKIKEENASKIEEYNVWKKRNDEIEEKFSK